MAGKYSWIVLFVTLQISVVLCRSTEKPNDEEKTVHAGPILFPHGQAAVVKAVDQYFADNLGESTPKSSVPSKMSYDVHMDGLMLGYPRFRGAVGPGTVALLIVGIFIILSFFVGCIAFCCCQKEKRRPGRIVSSNTEEQTAGIQQPETTAPGAPGTAQTMQQYPIP